jgi:hypothetical protein
LKTYEYLGKKACTTAHTELSHKFGKIVWFMSFKQEDGKENIIYIINIDGKLSPSEAEHTVILEG